MSDAIAKPSKRKGPDPREDAFLRFVNRAIAWGQDHLRTVVASGVIVVLLAGAGLWYLNYTENLEQQAATQLQTMRAALATGGDSASVDRVESYLDRFGGTESALEARLLLGRVRLRRGEPEQALEAARPVADQPADTPIGFAGRMLLARAQEAAGRVEEALGTLEELTRSARFGFQRREASAERARMLVEAGRLAEAEQIYRRLLDEAGRSDVQQLYAVRLGEIQALRDASGSSSSSGGTRGEASGEPREASGASS